MFDVAIVLLVVSALLAYVNKRYVGLPTTIGVMIIALGLSLLLVVLDKVGFGELRGYEESLLQSIDFSDVLLEGMLSMLLFAGAMHVDLSELKSVRWQVGILAVVGTVVSTLIVGLAMWWLLPLVGLPLSLGYCLLFGALISPTDPIAVMGILKTAGAPRELELLISGESLFNDGVGVVLFAMILAMVAGGHEPTVAGAGALFLREAGGGVVYGLALGYVTFLMLRSIDSYEEEVLITLAAVLGGYALAMHLHVSGPLAMVVVGLVIGNHGREYAMSHTTRQQLDMFWGLLDTMLNSVLFVLIGLEVLMIGFSTSLLVGAALAIVVTLVARTLSVALPMGLLKGVFKLAPGSWKILTWGGLRGGISVALVLSITAGVERDLLLGLTYCTVVFSIIVQGLTIGRLAKATPA